MTEKESEGVVKKGQNGGNKTLKTVGDQKTRKFRDLGLRNGGRRDSKLWSLDWYSYS